MTIILISNSDVKITTGTLVVEMVVVFVIVIRLDQLLNNAIMIVENVNAKSVIVN